MKDYSNINWEKLANEYIETGISLTQMSKKYEIGRWILTDRFKKLGIDIVNKQNEVKFDNTVFDVIDSEEKAYWLGLIYADGYISSQNFSFELCLKGSDIEHLNKFNKFMKHKDANHVKLSKAICKNTNKECSRCRWIICDKHLWSTLNSYGCSPQKSTILKFPNINIFKDLYLVKHFIRGYFDGDGSFSRHLHRTIVTPHIQILGTPEFLNGIEEYSNIIGIRGRDRRWTSNTEYIEFHKEEGIKFINYIYEDSKIYLDRKYKLFNFFRNGSRSLQEWNGLLQTENGEVCDDNPVLSSETKESEPVLSVEIEPEKSE